MKRSLDLKNLNEHEPLNNSLQVYTSRGISEDGDDYKYKFINEVISQFHKTELSQIHNKKELDSIYNLIKYKTHFKPTTLTELEYIYIYYFYIVKDIDKFIQYGCEGAKQKSNYLISEMTVYYSDTNDHDNAYTYAVMGSVNIITCISYLSYYYMYIKKNIVQVNYYVNLGMIINTEKTVHNVIKLLKISNNKDKHHSITIEKLSNNITILNTKNNKISDKLFILNDEIAKLQTILNVTKKRANVNEKISGNNKKLNSESPKLEDDNKKLNSENTKLSNNNQKLNSENTKLRDNNQKLTNVNAKLSDVNVILMDDYEKLANNNKMYINKISMDITKLKDVIEVKSKHIDELINDNEKSKKNIKELLLIIEKLNSDKISEKNRLDKIKERERLDKIKEKNDKLTLKINELLKLKSQLLDEENVANDFMEKDDLTIPNDLMEIEDSHKSYNKSDNLKVSPISFKVSSNSRLIVEKITNYDDLYRKKIKNICWRIGCNEKSVSAPNGKYTHIYCSDHLNYNGSEKPVYVCKVENCKEIATYGSYNSKKPNRCLTHGKLIKQSYPMNYRTCKIRNCHKLGFYTNITSEDFGNSSYCKLHKFDNDRMIKLYCNHYFCNNIPIFGYKNEKYPLVCENHKSDL